MKHVDTQGTGHLPSCSLSAHCLRLVDAMDPSTDAKVNGQIEEQDYQLSKEEIYDERLIAQLQTHVPTCSTCSATLAQARRMRSQQRVALRSLLAEGAERVPSTTTRILAAIHREPFTAHQAQQQTDASNHHEFETPLLIQPLDTRRLRLTGPTPQKKQRNMLRNILSLVAVAIVVFGSFALFSRLVLLRPSTASTTNPRTPNTISTSTPVPTILPPTPAYQFSTNWISVVVDMPDAQHPGQRIIANYDPSSGKSVQLIPSCCPSGTVVDGVSHNGHDVLYHFYDGNQTHYYLLPQREIYTLPGKAGNAVWTNDDQAVLIYTSTSVVQIDVQSATAKVLIPVLNAGQLTFYHTGFLYYTRLETQQAVALYRVNVATQQEQQVSQSASLRTLASTFWLKPDGSTIYYTGLSVSSQATPILAVDSDGKNQRSLARKGLPIGFAADSSLVFLQQVSRPSSAYQIVKLGQTLQQDSILLPDVAPGAMSIGDDVAVAPYGHTLLLQADYANGTGTLWADNLDNSQLHMQLTIPSLLPQAGAWHLIGWDKIVVSPQAPATPIASPTPTPSSNMPFQIWNWVAFDVPKSASGT